MVPKKIPMSRHVMTFFRRVASGNDRPTTAIINAIAVPNATPFDTKASIRGITPAALLYIGTARITANSTVHHCPPPKNPLKKFSGTKP